MKTRSTITLLPVWALAVLSLPALAVDHAEAPGTQDDPAADIADLYAWHTANGSIVAVLTFNGNQPPTEGATYDGDVLYGVHFDTNADAESDKDIWVRFGKNQSTGDWGVQVTDLPGSSGVIEGETETTLTDGDVKVWAGLREDPFFFDATGFFDSLSTGSIAFTGNDDFAGNNATAIVLVMTTSEATESSHTIQLWATTARK